MNVHCLTAAAALGLGLSWSALHAEAIELEPIKVGSGLMSSFLQIDFSDDEIYLFEISYSDIDMTGMDLLYTLDAELGDSFILEYQPSGFGNFITGLGFEDVFEANNDEKEQWWLYWVRDSFDDPWGFATGSADDRLVSDGSWDGWVFGGGIDDPPSTVKLIPAPPATLVLAGLLISGRRRRRTG